MTLSILALIRTLLQCVIGYFRVAEVRERMTLRKEIHALRFQLDEAVSAGDSHRISLVQDLYTDATRDLEALRAPPEPPPSAKSNDQGKGG